MPTVSASAIIPAGRESVFDFIADYRNIPRLQPHFASARLVSQVDKGTGAVVALDGRFHGMPMRAQNRIIAYDPPKRMVSISEGSVMSRSTWELQPYPGDENSTTVKLTIDYRFKQDGGLLGGLTRSFGQLFHGEIQGMTDDSLRRLKEVFSTQKSGTS